MSDYSVVTLAEHDLPRWEEFLRACDCSSFRFASSDWGKIFEGSGRRFVVHALEKKGRIVGGVAGQSSKWMGASIFSSIPLAPYNPWCQLDDANINSTKRQRFTMDGQQAVGDFLRQKYHLVSLINGPNVLDLRGFLWSGFYLETRYTFCVDLRDPEQLYARLNPDVRTKVRKAERLGWSFRHEQTSDVLVELLWETSRRQNFNISSNRPELKAICEKMLAKGRIRIFSVYSDGTAVAAVAVAHDFNGVVHEWLAGTRVDESTAGAFQFLFWKVLEFYAGCGEGWRTMDMDGAGVRGISHMKSQFGGEIVPITHVLSLGMAALQIGRRFFRTIGRTRG